MLWRKLLIRSFSDDLDDCLHSRVRVATRWSEWLHRVFATRTKSGDELFVESVNDDQYRRGKYRIFVIPPSYAPYSTTLIAPIAPAGELSVCLRCGVYR